MHAQPEKVDTVDEDVVQEGVTNLLQLQLSNCNKFVTPSCTTSSSTTSSFSGCACTRLFLAVHAKLFAISLVFCLCLCLTERYLQLFQALQIAKIASAQGAQTIACQNSKKEK